MVDDLDLDLDLVKFLENSKKSKKVKTDLKKCFNSEIYELKDNIKILFENEQNFILKEIKLLDINLISFSQIGRLQTILKFLVQENLNKYRTHIQNTYFIKDFLKSPEKPKSGSDKSMIEKYNKEIKEWQDESKKIKEFNSKLDTLTEWLESNITVDLYGDTTLNITNLPYVYFKFFNTDINEIEVFIQELKSCAVYPVKNIKRITIDDISANLPNFLKSVNEVRVYFETELEAEELNNSYDYVQGVYEKYVIKNDIMKKDGGEWGMYNKRNK